MSHTHDHGPGHEPGHQPGHDHSHDLAAASQVRVFWTFWLIAVFMVVEAVGGWWAGSLTLIADAGHMLTDSGALALAWFATRAVQRPSDAEKSYGHHRFSVLSALINGLGLIAIVGWIAIEAVQRLISPEQVKAVPMLAIAVTGFLVNAGAAWTRVDPILSVVASLLILRGAIGLVGKSWHVLMEATPEGVNVAEIAEALEALDGVTDIHHLHAWSLVPGKTLITLHAQLVPGHTSDEVLGRIKQTLAERFHIDHSTIQIEGACADDQDHRDHAVGGQAQDHEHTHKRKVAASR
jgi:cobalt-zinc-cadmium efflux system protein